MRSTDAGRHDGNQRHQGGLSEALDLGGVAGTRADDRLTLLDNVDRMALSVNWGLFSSHR